MKQLPHFSRISKENLGMLLGYVFLFAVLGLFLISERGESATDRVFDTIRTTENRPEAVIIGIDDASLKELGAWPWNRSHFADLTKALDDAGVSVAVYDVLFFEPRDGDEEFKRALSGAKHSVILASKLEKGAYLSSYLVQGSSTISSALANVNPDVDGKVRKYPDRHLEGGDCILSLSEKAFILYARKEMPACENQSFSFRYPDTVPVYSLIDVVRGQIPRESLFGKVAFIGSTSLGLEDHFVGMEGAKIPGVYVHASAFVSYLNAIDDEHLPLPFSLLIIALTMYVARRILYQVKKIALQVVGIALLVVLMVVFAVFIYSFGYMTPLSAIVAAILLSAGYTALVRYVDARKQNLFIESVFSKYVHKDVLQELLRSGKDISLGGERKQLTILFSDIRGFTSLSESLSPEDLTAILNDYLTAMTPCILEEKGTIDKFIGDAIMAFWNAPLEVEDHAHHAVKSALLMQRTLAFFNEVKKTSLEIGIGIHTGYAVVGNVGGRDRVSYTVLGDTVNLASRIEGLTKKYGVGIVVTKAVRDTIQDPMIAFRCLDVITVAGKSTPTTLYEAQFADNLSDDTIKRYEKALKHYYHGEWDKAEPLFKKLAKEGDVPSQKMLERIPGLRKKKDWDGVYRFDEK